MKIKQATEIVKNYLEENPHLRDDDLKLYANIIWFRFTSQMKHKLTEDELKGARKLLKCISQGDLPHFESIRRSRAQIQKLHPSLRGDAWYKRHKQSKQVKQDIIQWEDTP